MSHPRQVPDKSGLRSATQKRVNLNRRAYETQRNAKHESLRLLEPWLAEMLVRNQNSPGKPAFDREAYERERLAKHGKEINVDEQNV